MKGIKKALSYITNVEYAIMVVTFVAMVIAYFISVVNRNFIKVCHGQKKLQCTV